MATAAASNTTLDFFSFSNTRRRGDLARASGPAELGSIILRKKFRVNWKKRGDTPSKIATNPIYDSEEMLGIVLSSLSQTAFEYDMSTEEKQMFLDELKLAIKEFTAKGIVMVEVGIDDM